MPMEAFYAQLWAKAPGIDPDEIEDWPYDKVMRYLKYQQLADDVREQKRQQK